jgi:hypothetical protein
VTRELLPLLAFVWLAMLLFVGLVAYSFGWWYRGRYEKMNRYQRERQLRREWEWNRRLAEQQQRPDGPPELRVVE